MKLNIGDRYNLSEKLKKAFEANEDTCKIISISSSITTLQIGSEIYSIKTETAIENLSLAYVAKADLSDDSPKRRRKKKEDNDKIDNMVEPKPISIIKDEEVVIPPPAIFPELPSTPSAEPMVEPMESVKPKIEPVVEPKVEPVEPKIIIITPENNNIMPSPAQDNDEPENPDEGFF